jgi:cystathionine beta-lyase
MDFDRIIDRRGSLSVKWEDMEALYGVSPDDGIAMWVADTDFASPDCVQDAVRKMLEHGVYGYTGRRADQEYRAAICWWMENRHGWSVDPSAIFTATGLGNGVGMVLDAYTNPGDGVVLFTPVYHSFARITRAAGRKVVECPMVIEDGRYKMNFDAYDAILDGSEKIVIFCSPHNPGGMVWSVEEQKQVVEFCRKHNLLLVSDEIHHDLVYPGHTHVPMPNAVPDSDDILIMLTAPSKTFNIAGTHTGNVIIPNAKLRAAYAERSTAINLSSNSFGVAMTTAAYSPEGAAWVDELMVYLDGNRKAFEEGIAAIPGAKPMAMEATYLSWVDFSGTGMSDAEIKDRIFRQAQVAPNYGETFGTGGETFMRFNLGTPRSRITEAVARLQEAFKDLQ